MSTMDSWKSARSPKPPCPQNGSLQNHRQVTDALFWTVWVSIDSFGCFPCVFLSQVIQIPPSPQNPRSSARVLREICAIHSDGRGERFSTKIRLPLDYAACYQKTCSFRQRDVHTYRFYTRTLHIFYIRTTKLWGGSEVEDFFAPCPGTTCGGWNILCDAPNKTET